MPSCRPGRLGQAALWLEAEIRSWLELRLKLTEDLHVHKHNVGLTASTWTYTFGPAIGVGSVTRSELGRLGWSYTY